MTDSLWYPSVEDVVAIHDDIVAEYPDTPPGVRNPGDVEFALNYVEEGSFGSAPDTIHEKAYHLLRLLVANHPSVDANKRTALNATVVFYFLNGCRFEYDDEVRAILKAFGTDEAAMDEEGTTEYLRSRTGELDLAGEIDERRDELVNYGLDRLTGDSSDPTINGARSVRSGMTTEGGAETASPLDEVMEDIRRELVRRVAAGDRDSNRDIYDALEDE
ncbi:death on curing protein [Halorubrum sodomense]|uniref:Death on curing protein n=2 Tax=Halorubrum TaxID=56688 RepID=A0A1I6FKC6_HALSD|nr:type II toxin-antitoxin system death-on-curing family toxin [Halorubrum sodomense]SFR30399.1 death on curing protein [Halorubrum sodomense]